MAEPRHQRGESKQDYGTPQSLIDAVKRELGITDFSIDLAASPSNAKAVKYYTQADNSLVQEWAGEGWMWCNPPYAHIAPWVEKALHAPRTSNIAMLLPASVGSNWWRDNVHGEATVWFLNGRVKFDGALTHSPKDHAIVLYTRTMVPAYNIWSWQ